MADFKRDLYQIQIIFSTFNTVLSVECTVGLQRSNDDNFTDMEMDEESAVAAQPKLTVQLEATDTDGGQPRRGAKTPQEWEKRQEFLDGLLTNDMQLFEMTAVFRWQPDDLALVLADMAPTPQTALQCQKHQVCCAGLNEHSSKTNNERRARKYRTRSLPAPNSQSCADSGAGRSWPFQAGL